MPADRIHVGDYGFRFTFVTGYDFTGYSSLEVKLRKPDGTLVTKTANTSDASGGEFYYTVEDGVIDQKGTWRAQGVVNFSGKELKTSVLTFPVASNI